jgi:hypothetical protein
MQQQQDLVYLQEKRVLQTVEGITTVQYFKSEDFLMFLVYI